MKRLDILILRSFFGPFLLTTVVATFILLIQYMLKYFDDFVGKNLGVSVFAELLFYFSLNMLQVALPLGVLVSSLMTFGTLGEQFELTAIKSAGISLVRTMRSIFFFVVLLSIAAFFFNNYIVPAANLKAYSLLYDIKNKKPALDIKPGVFYNGIPNYSIKVADKFADNKTLKDIIIYDHTQPDGNRRVILADSSRMYTILNEKYLKLELFDGNYYNEQDKSDSRIDQFYRTGFDQMEMVFNLSSFDLKRTKEELFRNNRQMKNISELTIDIDSLQDYYRKTQRTIWKTAPSYLFYHMKSLEDEVQEVPEDSLSKEKNVQEAGMHAFGWMRRLFQEGQDTKKLDTTIFSIEGRVPVKSKLDTITKLRKNRELMAVNQDTVDSRPLDSVTMQEVNDYFKTDYKRDAVLKGALTQARNFRVNIKSLDSRLRGIQENHAKYVIEKYKKFSQAFACIVMFLIGAPLGAIIKKGGLGVPVIISIFFFIIYYVLTISSEKWARAGLMEGEVAVWVADLVLFPIGLFFLRQARIDARLFDTDFYLVVMDKIKERWKKSKLQTA
jgi:lipopolysaccharide export system permease protein